MAWLRGVLGVLGDVFSVATGLGAVLAALGVVIGFTSQLPWPLTVALAIALFGLGLIVVSAIRSWAGGRGPGESGLEVVAPAPVAAPERPPAVRVRLADPPDAYPHHSYLDEADLTVTNESARPLVVRVTAHWAERNVELLRPWDDGNRPIEPNEKARFAFVARLREGDPDGANDRHGYPFAVGRCYVLDYFPPSRREPGWDLGIGRVQIRIETRSNGALLDSRRFDIYVPEDACKPMWVVPRGVDGSG